MSARWLLPFLTAYLAQQSSGLVQVATHKGEHLAVHEGVRRTLPRHGQSVIATATLGNLGEVDLTLPQRPGVISRLDGDTVYGDLMLIALTPEKLARDPAAVSAAQSGIKQVVGALQLRATSVTASLEWLKDFPEAVRVDFEAAFSTSKGRQAFTRSVVGDGGRQLAKRICGGMPGPVSSRCLLAGASWLQRDGGDDFRSSLVSLEPHVALDNCSGTIFLKPLGPPQHFVEDPEWQEAVAMAMSEVAWVSRLQVGTLMAVEANTVRVDFWLTMGGAKCSEAAIVRVRKAAKSITTSADEHVFGWRWSRNRSRVLHVYGRMALEVPRPQYFSRNTSVVQAMSRALAQVASSPSPEASQLSVTGVNVSLTMMENTSRAVRAGFCVTFGNPRDRQVFTWDFARDGGKKLADRINAQLPSVCEGNCRLAGQRSGKATQAAAPPPDDDDLGKQSGAITVKMPDPQSVVSDPLVPEAMATAISEMTSVPQQQVGILVTNSHLTYVFVDFWVGSSNKLRQAAVRRVELAGRSKFLRCTLAHLDRMYDQVRSRHPVDAANASIVLDVPAAAGFANSAAVARALRSAIAEVVQVPIRQVIHVEVRTNVSDRFPQFVRVDFQISGGGENCTRALAGDGVQKLVHHISELVPKPFKGQCRLPVLNQTEVGNGTLRAQLGQPYGTMLLYMFNPEQYLSHARREAIAMTIAEVASVPRWQVGVLLKVKSPVLLSIDFWVMSTDAVLQRAAVQRVNMNWTDADMGRYWQRLGHTSGCPVSMVSGGTVLKGIERYKC